MLICVILSCLSADALSADWTFESIAREAMSSHPAVQSKKHAEEGAASEVEAQKWQRFPVPGVQAGRDTKSNSNSAVFSLQQPLWTGGKITAGIEAATWRQKGSHESVRGVRQEVLQNVIDSYVDAVVKQAQIIILKDNIANHERLFEMISRRAEREISPRADKELAHSRLRSATNDLSFAMQALSNALTQLSELTGKDVDSVAVSHAELLTSLPVSRNEAIALSLAHSPTLSTLAYSRQAAEADVDSKRSSYWPMLALRLEKNAGPNSDQRAMIFLESQFGAGLSASSNVSAAISQREAITWQRMSAERDLKNTVSQEWKAFVESRLRYDNTSQTSVSSWSVYESYVRLYSVSQKSWLDVLNSLREAVQAKLAVESANAEVVRSSLRLKVLTGKLFPDASSDTVTSAS